MRIQEKNLRQGFVKVVPDTQDDLWHLYNVIYKDDKVYAYTSRAIKTDSEASRPKSGERVSAFMGVKVESVAWDRFLGKLRVHGIIIHAPDIIPTGAHHTISVSLNQPVTIVKPTWPKHSLDRLQRASEAEKPLLIVAIDDEGYAIAETKQYGIEVKVEEPAFVATVGIFLVLVLSAGTYGVWLTQQSPRQPIQFNHSLHLGFGVQCLYCHPGAWKGQSAGLPTETKCWGCHQQIPIKDSEQQKLADAVYKNEPIKWVPVFILPDYVYFNHRPHIAFGLNCETCHGELSRMTVAQPRHNLNMGWCLHCHRTLAAGDATLLIRLTDCGTCHR